MKKRAEKTAKKGSSIPGKRDSFSEEAQKVFPKQRMKGLNEPEGSLWRESLGTTWILYTFTVAYAA